MFIIKVKTIGRSLCIKVCFAVLFVSAVILSQIYDTAGWTTLHNYQTPEWYQDAKFGIYMHWGVYSYVAHGNEWYGYGMYDKLLQGLYYTPKMYSYHLSTYGDPGTFGYKDFIPFFKAENFNADSIATIVANAGAKYYAHLTSHHEAFMMYGSSISRWNCVAMGPKKDVGRQIQTAIKKKGLRFGISNHLAENDWFFQFNWHNNFDAVKDTSLRDLYNDSVASIDLANTQPTDRWCNRWMALSKEMIDYFQPDYVYYDRGWSMHPKWTSYRKSLAVYQYNKAIEWGKGVYGAPGVVLLYKDTGIVAGGAVLDEEFAVPDAIQARPFQCELSVSNQWGYVLNDTYRTSSYIINYMVNAVSKNGNFCLSLNPMSNGLLPDSTKKRLTEIGGWMAINGEAIYASRPAATFGLDGTNQIRYTRNKDTTVIYIFSANWPGNGAVFSISSYSSANLNSAKISKITMLGNGNTALTWTQNATALSITMPATKPTATNYCYVFKMYLDNAMTLPAAPSNLTAEYAPTTGINLKWVNNTTKATGFKIERKTGAAGTFSQIATMDDTVTSYVDLSIMSGSAYTYRVRASNASGNSVYSNEATPQNEQPTGVTQAPQTRRTIVSPGSTITTSLARVSFDAAYNGRIKNVSVYDVNGKLHATKTMTGNSIDLQKDFGISSNVYVVKVKIAQ